MYLYHIYIENNGPIKSIGIEFAFSPDGKPKAVILVGGNGSGKTNLLSMIGDALFEAAAKHYQTV